MSLELPSLLVLYCYVTNCHTFSSLKEHSSTYNSINQTSRWIQSSPSSVLQGPKQCGQVKALRKNSLLSIQVVGWIQIPEPVGLRFSFPCWLSGTLVLAPQGYYFSHGPFIFTSSSSTPSPSHTSDLPDFSFCCKPKKISTFKRLSGSSTQIIFPS